MSANGSKPDLTLNLDALEREGEVPGPFTFQADGDTYQMLDPKEVDWQDLLAGMRNPALFVRFAMPVEQQKKFFALRIPGWKMNALMQAYQDHFDIPDLGNAYALRT